jgi:chaperonin GroEL (HSP60 family)
MSHLLTPQIVIMKAGTEDSSGKGQIISNINACQAVVDVVKTTLGKYPNKSALRFKTPSIQFFGATIGRH